MDGPAPRRSSAGSTQNETWQSPELTAAPGVSGHGTRALFSGVTLGTDGEAATLAARLRAAHDLVGRVLSGHQEAQSRRTAASHRRVLAAPSAPAAADSAATADMARLRYEELRHRVDPRTKRPLSFWMALVLVVAIGAGLAGLSLIELAALPGREVTAAAVAAVWIAGAWLAAATHRDGHAGRTAAAVAAAAALAALLTALHAVGAPGWGQSLAGLLWAVLSGAIAATAAALIRRAEPVALAQARGRWRRAQAHHVAAVRTSLADAQSAAIARESWLGLVRSAAAGQGGGQLTRDSTEVAAGMI